MSKVKAERSEETAMRTRDASSFLIPHRLLGHTYVRLMGRAYQGLGVKVVYGPENLFESAARFDAIHLHWPEEQYREFGSGAVETRAASFLQRLDEHKRGGTKLIWTVHNIVPHEHVSSDLDAKIYQGVIDRSDLIVHHCARSVELLSTAYTVPSSIPTVVIPFGNYAGYPDSIGRHEARDRLDIPQDAIVYLYFGAIRGYKGFDTLLRAYRRARVKRKFLVVAGYYTGAGGLRGKLGTLRLSLVDWFDRRARLDLKRIDDRDVQTYFRAADAVVLSHGWGLNSGVAVLGMTFGKIVIGPDLGCISNVLRQGENLIYPTNDVAELVRAMERVPTLDLAKAEATNARVAASWTWPGIGQTILDALEEQRAPHTQASQ
jgi:beta-1,4-mannosyltransferase